MKFLPPCDDGALLLFHILPISHSPKVRIRAMTLIIFSDALRLPREI